jgi:hypothetical protein
VTERAEEVVKEGLSLALFVASDGTGEARKLDKGIFQLVGHGKMVTEMWSEDKQTKLCFETGTSEDEASFDHHREIRPS